MITVRINNVDYVLQRGLGRAQVVVGKSVEGGFILAEVVAIHTHECIRRRWGRKNRLKPCSCGADTLALQVGLK